MYIPVVWTNVHSMLVGSQAWLKSIQNDVVEQHWIYPDSHIHFEIGPFYLDTHSSSSSAAVRTS